MSKSSDFCESSLTPGGSSQAADQGFRPPYPYQSALTQGPETTGREPRERLQLECEGRRFEGM